MLELFFDPVESKFNKLSITIDGQEVLYTVELNKICIQQSVDCGIHILRLCLVGAGRFSITDVFLNGAGLRGSLYLSYIDENSNKSQPTTCVWEPTQTWVLPFGNPVSHWLSKVSHSLDSSKLGTNLYDLYDLFYPEPVTLADHFPPVVKDFFKYDFDFTVIDKHHRKKEDYPYYSLDVDQSLIDAANLEIIANLDWFYQRNTTPAQVTDNQRESIDLDLQHWSVFHFIKRNAAGVVEFQFDKLQFPALLALVNSVGMIDNERGVIAFTKPQSFVSPHIDPPAIFKATEAGCTQVYIPLIKGTLCKFAGVGVFPDQPLVINNNHFMHAIANTTDQTRIAIIMRGDVTKNKHIFKIS